MAKTQQGYALGLDSSTQSLTAVAIDLESMKVAFELSLDYARDERLNTFGIDHREYLVPPRVPGEADQPPQVYLASLDAAFADMTKAGFPLGAVRVVNISGQQHGHLYLAAEAAERFAALGSPSSIEGDLASLLRGSFAYGTAPIWRTSNTASQADAIRSGAGGRERVIELSGSDSPLRFTGAVMRRVAEEFPAAFRRTRTVELISSFLSGVLAGRADAPIDFGNGSGMSLMDYRKREWSPELVQAAARDIEGGAPGFRAKLPPLAAPDSSIGRIAAYFVAKYGFSPDCLVAAGSGDNPQTKVLVSGDLLSLGTSFVFMVSTDGTTVDREGYANAMYDGVGRPFMFGCRTNGAMTWDRVRALHGLAKKEYARAESALAAGSPGGSLFFWQPEHESLPSSPAFEPTRIGYAKPSLEGDYCGVIDSTLAAVYVYSRHFARESREPLFVTGGATESPQIMRRVAALWKRPVAAIGRVGAALGTAVSAASALKRETGAGPAVEELCRALLPAGEPVGPAPADVAAYHGDGGYLARFRAEYPRLFASS